LTLPPNHVTTTPMADIEQDDDPAEMPDRRFGVSKLGFENY
jgi:hypothetical protein